jgi:hypothetical protein
MGTIMCTFLPPPHKTTVTLEDRIKALEAHHQSAAHDAACDARMDALMEHGDQMLSMMNEFKSILDATDRIISNSA